MDDGLEEMIMNPGDRAVYGIADIHYDKLCKEGI